MKVSVLAFASAADALGSRELELELEDGTTVGQLLDRLQEASSSLETIRPRLAIAVNGRLLDAGTVLADRDEVALLPPVSGGDAPPPAWLTREPVRAADVTFADPGCGAEVIFVGRVRDHSRPPDAGEPRGVTRITYQGYEAMAEAALLAICRDLSRDDVRLRIVHRLGDVDVGEASVAIAARAPHRREAFATCAEALERLKREAPIWKLEHYDDGSLAWREEEPLSVGTGSPASRA